MSTRLKWIAAFFPLAIGCTSPGTEIAVLPDSIRIATFNIWELSREKLEAVDSAGAALDSQVVAAATLLKRIRPDIVLVNEIDVDATDPARVAQLFVERHLRTGSDPLDYPYVYSAPSNTGDLSGLDLNRDGVTATASLRGDRAYGDDSWGFGTYPGQYGMAVLSRFPIDTARARTFRLFRWHDLPGHHLPEAFWPSEVIDQVRLSSKNHLDVPVIIGNDTLHLLASHPTPPSFDGAEDRNGRRNFDEIGFWARYLDGNDALVDDNGVHGGLDGRALFVVLGDLNADPVRTDTLYDGKTAMAQLLEHPRLQPLPAHDGINTASFLGGRRVDYVLPARELVAVGGGVFAPDSTADPTGAALARAASDHRMVWLDLRLPLREVDGAGRDPLD